MPPVLWMTASGALHVAILALWWFAAPSAPVVFLPEGASAAPIRVILVAASSQPEDLNGQDIPVAPEAPTSPQQELEARPTDATPPTTTVKSGARLNRTALAIHSPAPQYPEQARRQGQEGTVEMRVFIDDDGNVTRVELANSSGHELLDRSAREALEKWRFQPALRAGLATSTVERQRFVFRLQDS